MKQTADEFIEKAKEIFENKVKPQIKKANTQDSIVESVITQFKARSERGIDKYGVTLDRTDLSTLEWLIHLQEELMDATLYIERLKNEQIVTNKSK